VKGRNKIEEKKKKKLKKKATEASPISKYQRGSKERQSFH